MTPQTLNLVPASIGALAGLATVPHLPNEVLLAAGSVTVRIIWLSRGKHRRPVTLALCAILGLACTRLTVALVS